MGVEAMTEEEAFFESVRYGETPFLYPNGGQQPVGRPREDDPQFMGRIVDLFELQSVRSAIKLMQNVVAWSRTPAAGKLRMLAVQYVIFGEPGIDTIKKRMRVSRRPVFQAIRRCGAIASPSLNETSLLSNCVKYSVRVR
jgi:hypothetical protein